VAKNQVKVLIISGVIEKIEKTSPQSE